MDYVQQYQETGSHIERMDMKRSPKAFLNYQNRGGKLVGHLMKRGTDKTKTNRPEGLILGRKENKMPWQKY